MFNREYDPYLIYKYIIQARLFKFKFKKKLQKYNYIYMKFPFVPWNSIVMIFHKLNFHN